MGGNWGGWRQLATIGEGGQGQVRLVEHDGGSGRYVLKQLKNRERIDRMKTEVRACLALEHPNIVKIVDVDLDSTKPYLVMEYCEGGDFTTAAIRDQTLPRKLRLLAKVADAVAYAHGQGIVHRDLKPANLLLRDPDTPVVADFGICWIADSGERVTLTEEAVGPRDYMAPELEAGRAHEVLPSADVYSLGKVLYWLVSGRDLPREKHKDSAWDLRAKDSVIFRVYRLLDETIVEDATKRIQNGALLAERLREEARLMEEGAHELGVTVPQRCDFCRVGEYQIRVGLEPPGPEHPGNVADQVRAFGLSDRNPQVWRILVCGHCGHVQFFRTDGIHGKNPWGW